MKSISVPPNGMSFLNLIYVCTGTQFTLTIFPCFKFWEFAHTGKYIGLKVHYMCTLINHWLETYIRTLTDESASAQLLPNAMHTIRAIPFSKAYGGGGALNFLGGGVPTTTIQF